MSDQPGFRFTVQRLSSVAEQIRNLVRRATQLGLRTEALQTLKTVADILETRPLEWGDPLYRTKKEGGVVCHGMLAPWNVHFAVFESYRVVWILDLKPLPGHPLANS